MKSIFKSVTVNKKSILISIPIMFFLLAIFFTKVYSLEETPVTLYVSKTAENDTGIREDGARYINIQTAIDKALPGDKIVVEAGEYLENLNISKEIKLIGSGSDSTIISPKKNNYTITIGKIETAETAASAAHIPSLLIEGFSIVSNKKNMEKGCIYLHAYANDDEKLTIKNNKFVGEKNKNTFTSGIGIYSPSILQTKENSSQICVRNLYLSHNEFYDLKIAMQFRNIKNSVIEQNKIKNIRLGAILLNSNIASSSASATATIENINIKENIVNDINNDYSYIPSSCGAINISPNVSNIEVVNNTLLSKKGTSIYIKEGINNNINTTGVSPKNLKISENILSANIVNKIVNYKLDVSHNFFNEEIKRDPSKDSTIIFSPYYTDKEMSKLSNEVHLLELNETNISLNKGDMFTLTYKIEAGKEAPQEINWSSTDANIVSVENGIIKGLTKGSATVFLKVANKQVNCDVSVSVINKSDSTSLVQSVVPYSTQSKEELSRGNTNVVISPNVIDEVYTYNEFNNKLDVELTLEAKNLRDNISNINESTITTNISVPDSILRRESVSLKELIVQSDTFTLAREHEKDLTFNVNDNSGKKIYSYTFYNASLRDENSFNLSLNTEKIDNTHPQKKDIEDNKAILINFENNTTLPGEAKVELFLGKHEFSSTDKLWLYYLNTNTNELEFCANNISVDNELYASFPLFHTSSYILTNNMLNSGVNNPVPSYISTLIILPLCIIGFCLLIYFYKRKHT